MTTSRWSRRRSGRSSRSPGCWRSSRSTVSLDDIGGLENLKTWLRKRNGSWLDEAAAYGLPAPKGVLVTGVPGCGKSMTAKAMASAWSLPLVRLDIGRVFGGLVGASEQNMRTALRTAEAIAPCVHVDRRDREGLRLRGVRVRGQRDVGAGVRHLPDAGCRRRPRAVFVMATANEISLLPPEMMRKGRFDEIFFIDLPTDAERRVIFSLHLKARLKAGPALGALPVTDELLGRLCTATEGFSGAEIEQVVIAACFDAFNERRRADGRRPAARDREHRAAVGDPGRADRRAAGLGRHPRGRGVRPGGPGGLRDPGARRRGGGDAAGSRHGQGWPGRRGLRAGSIEPGLARPAHRTRLTGPA